MTDFTAHLHKLAKAEEDGDDRVYTWRQILKEVHDAGWQEDYIACSLDRALKDQLNKRPVQDAPAETHDG